MHVEYASNNSGGDWWLKDEDWRALEKAGWVIEWTWLSKLYSNKGTIIRQDNGLPKLVPSDESNKEGDRWLGSLASKAYKPNCNSLRDAADEWEKITGQLALDAGCPCCGQPHNFTLYSNDAERLESGPDINYECSW